jgi:hypothetical protein
MRKIANYEIREEENNGVRILFEYFWDTPLGNRKIYLEKSGRLKMVLFPPKDNDVMFGEDGFMYEFYKNKWSKMGLEWDEECFAFYKENGNMI